MNFKQYFLIRKKNSGKYKRPVFELACYDNLTGTHTAGYPFIFSERAHADGYLKAIGKTEDYQVIIGFLYVTSEEVEGQDIIEG